MVCAFVVFSCLKVLTEITDFIFLTFFKPIAVSFPLQHLRLKQDSGL